MLLEMNTISVRPHKPLPTDFTLVRLLTCVNPNVLNEMTLLFECFSAAFMLTFEWSVTTMHFHVSFQLFFSFEHFLASTKCTLESIVFTLSAVSSNSHDFVL